MKWVRVKWVVWLLKKRQNWSRLQSLMQKAVITSLWCHHEFISTDSLTRTASNWLTLSLERPRVILYSCEYLSISSCFVAMSSFNVNLMYWTCSEHRHTEDLIETKKNSKHHVLFLTTYMIKNTTFHNNIQQKQDTISNTERSENKI